MITFLETKKINKRITEDLCTQHFLCIACFEDKILNSPSAQGITASLIKIREGEKPEKKKKKQKWSTSGTLSDRTWRSAIIHRQPFSLSPIANTDVLT